jgi:hypothetical protein
VQRGNGAKALAVLALVAALASGCGTSPLAPPDEMRVPLSTTAYDVEVLGATGDAIWAEFAGAGNRVSLDGGRTWRAGVVYPEYGRITASAGRFAFSGGDDGVAMPMTFAAGTPDNLERLPWEDDGRRVEALGADVVLWANGHLSTREATRKTSWPKLQPGRSQYLFSADSTWLVRIVHGGRSDQLSVAPVATGVGRAPLTFVDALDYAVGTAGLYSLVSDRGQLSVCTISLPEGARACTPVADWPHATATFHQAGAVTVVKADGRGYLVENGQVTPIALPDDTSDWKAEGAGDPTRPLLLVTDNANQQHHYRAAADGSLTEAFPRPRLPVVPVILALTPTAVYGSQDVTTTFWRRDIGARGLGEEVPLRTGEVRAASGDRLLVQTDNSVRVLDGGTPGPVLGDAARQLSGPYVLLGSQVVTATGDALRTDPPEGIFGSLAVQVSHAAAEHRQLMTVHDLTNPDESRTIQLSGTDEKLLFARLWGDWVGVTFRVHGDQRTTELHNWRTDASRTTAGELAALGDGFAVILRSTGKGWDQVTTLLTVDLATGAETVLAPAVLYPAPVTDGVRVAYVDGSDLVVRKIPGAGASAPRLLGALTSGSATPADPWTVALDMTKAVAPGTLTIRSADGAVVRVLPTSATASGSVRGPVWDGRDDAGAAVTSGEYRWEYAADAADGTGAVRDVTGQTAPGGTIDVS